MSRKAFYITLYFCFLAFAVHSQKTTTVLLNNSQREILLVGSQLGILIDTSGNLSINEVSKSTNFIPHTTKKKFASVENTSYVYWVCFSLKEVDNWKVFF